MTSIEGFTKIPTPLPIEIAPGIFWLGECTQVSMRGEVFHSGASGYLVAGDEHAALVETTQGQTAALVLEHIDDVTRYKNLPDIKYVCVTHSEPAHSGGTGHALAHFPDAIACGEVSDLHLIFPQFAERLRLCDPGEEFDLGGTKLRVVEAVFRDMTFSRWFFDTRSRTLFTADGFAFSHEHTAEHCGHFVEDLEDLDIPAHMKIHSIAAFNYTQYIDIEPYLERLKSLVDELDVNIIAPGHGLPIRDPESTLPRIFEGYRSVKATPQQGLLT
jgi:flavorubredoxin